MKKVITAIGAIALAFGVQAANVKWTVNTKSTAYSGWSVYIYNTAADTIASALSATIAADAVPTGWTSVLGTAVTSGTLTTKGALANQIKTDVNTADTWTAVLISKDGFVDGSEYAIMSSVAVAPYAYDPQSTATPSTMTMSTIASTGTLSVASVPEPTSGLLLLLGMAGLALKRKHA